MNYIELVKRVNPKALKKRKKLPTPLVPLAIESKFYKAIMEFLRLEFFPLIEKLKSDVLRIGKSFGMDSKFAKDGFLDIILGWVNTVKETIITKVNAFIKPLANSIGVDTNNWNASQIEKMLVKTTKVEPIYTQSQQYTDLLNGFVIENTQLIKKLTTEQLESVQGVIIANYTAQPKNFKEILEAEIKRVLNVSDTRAKLIAVDQVNKLDSQFSEARYKDLGFDSYIWITKADLKVRPEHRQMHNKIVYWNNPPTITGGLHAGRPIRCRCKPVPNIYSDDIV